MRREKSIYSIKKLKQMSKEHIIWLLLISEKENRQLRSSSLNLRHSFIKEGIEKIKNEIKNK